MLVSGAAGGELDAGTFTPIEQLVFTFLVIFSALFWSIVIASFCDVISNRNPTFNEFRQNMVPAARPQTRRARARGRAAADSPRAVARRDRVWRRHVRASPVGAPCGTAG